MRLFSHRKGFKPVKSVVQVDSMDNDLRNGLWNALTIHYWNLVKESWLPTHATMYSFCKTAWDLYFKRTIDTLSKSWPDTRDGIRSYFLSCPWYEVYDFIEFVANNYPDKYKGAQFMNYCNSILEREVSGYRFVGDKITQITSEQEIAEVEAALQLPGTLSPVSKHLQRALELLADRKSPDYRNSIKESVSGVEAVCKLLAGERKASLAKALQEIEKKVPMHSALKRAFNSLYGYSSDAEGIRHALLEEEKLDFDDAKFMLVCCSAFVNYLVSKSSDAGIELLPSGQPDDSQ